MFAVIFPVNSSIDDIKAGLDMKILKTDDAIGKSLHESAVAALVRCATGLDHIT
jgi:hypothetical protein